MEKFSMVIYRVTNKLNNKVYIGQTINAFNKRKVQHLSDARRNVYPSYYFHKALRKYGEKKFTWEILHKNIKDFCTLDVLEQLEIIINDSFYNGYNMTMGGEGFHGYRHSEETKQKIKLNNAKYWKNRIVPQEMRNKISNTLKGRYSGEKNPFYGKKHTEETKIKVSMAGKKRPANTYFRKTVLQVDKYTGKVINTFDREADAKRTLGINNIAACCYEKQRTAGGFVWILESDFSKKYIKKRLDLVKAPHGNKKIEHKKNRRLE